MAVTVTAGLRSQLRVTDTDTAPDPADDDEFTMRCDRRLRCTRGDERTTEAGDCGASANAAAEFVAEDGGGGGRDSSFDDGASVMMGRCGGCGWAALELAPPAGGGLMLLAAVVECVGEGSEQRSPAPLAEKAGEAERLRQLRIHRSGVMRVPG